MSDLTDVALHISGCRSVGGRCQTHGGAFTEAEPCTALVDTAAVIQEYADSTITSDPVVLRSLALLLKMCSLEAAEDSRAWPAALSTETVHAAVLLYRLLRVDLGEQATNSLESLVSDRANERPLVHV